MSLIARNICLSLQRKVILDDVDFTAEPGEVTAIVGPNGSGKTSLMRVMTGEETAQGQIHLNGIAVTRANAHQLAAIRGVLPQFTRVAFPFTASEIIRIGHQSGVHAAENHIAEQALEAVGLSGFGPRYIQELSGGEQQRVQLARVMAQVWQPVLDGQPCWLFLDEPVASLDIGHQLSIMQLARDFALRGGGVVVVMHDLNLTAMYADRIVLMQAGQARQTGTPADVLTDRVLSDAYGCAIRASTTPTSHIPYILPQAVKRL